MQEVNVFEGGQPVRGGYRDISPAAAYQARGKALLIDVREPSEFNAELGHIAGSELVPLGTIGHHVERWDKAADLILICRSGARSGRAAETLARAGFTRVMNMAGGMLAYNAANLPVERT
jgi:rhodanese-related sulfurtransferase